MSSIKNLGVPVSRGTVVGDDVFPFGGIHSRPVDRRQRQRGMLRTQIKFLAGNNHIRSQPVPNLQVGHRDAMALGNEREVFPRFTT